MIRHALVMAIQTERLYKIGPETEVQTEEDVRSIWEPRRENGSQKEVPDANYRLRKLFCNNAGTWIDCNHVWILNLVMPPPGEA